MTRIRVHELAKELNMENQDLIDKIIKLGFQVKNHMSTLTDSAVLKVRQQYTETRSETVEQKRIGREVIRRRKKVELIQEPEETQAAPADAEETFEPVPVESEIQAGEVAVELELTPIPEIPPEMDEQEPVVVQPQPQISPESAPPGKETGDNQAA